MTAYQDIKGIWTIGYGTNLQKLVIKEELAVEWLTDHLDQAEMLAGGFPWFADLSQPRKDVVIEMIYNLGLAGFGKFGKMHRAVLEKRWDDAAAEMLDSDWRKQVGLRAERLAQQMRSGEYWNVA